LNVPQMWLRALGEAMGELHAEEAFREAEIVAVGAGKLDKIGRDKVTRRWRAALGTQGGVRLTADKSGLALLAALGIRNHNDGPR
jgi:hypothetical protein